MKNAILLHGVPSSEEYHDPNYPSASNSHWFPWLQKMLLINDIKADTPEVFRAYELAWKSWISEVERFPIGPDTTLVGHSAGGGFWVRYLSEHPDLFVDKVILVAPWLDPERTKGSTFYDFKVDPTILKRANQFIIYASDNDGPSRQVSLDLLSEKLPGVSVRTFHEYGHFTHRTLKDDMFPELLEEILS